MFNYTVSINNKKGDLYDEFFYSYGQTKNISLKIYSRGLSISARMTVDKRVEELIENTWVFKYGLLKALKVYLLIFRKNLQVESITITKNSEGFDEEKFILEKTIFNLFLNEKTFTLSKNFREKAVIEKILDINKSAKDRRISALNAYIVSKTKNDLSEKLLYLWISTNGIYSFTSQKREKDFRQEHKKIESLMNKYKSELGGKLPNTTKHPDLINYIISFINENKIENKNDLLYKANDIEGIIRKTFPVCTTTAYGFVMIGLGYYFRNNYVHANESLEMFSYIDGEINHALNLTNLLLDEFINDKLPGLFLED